MGKPTVRRRAVLTAAAALGAAAVAATTAATTATAAAPARPAPARPAPARPAAHPAPARPTVVLVHGAFAESASWNGVVQRLQRDGYPVIAPANPLRGVHTDAAHLAALLKTVKGPIVLAGHSYGGSVISEAAAHNHQVKALVYIAAFAPAEGESAAELSGRFPGGTLGPTLTQVTVPAPGGTTATDLYIKQDRFRAQFAADVPAATAAAMAATQRPIAATALEDKATETAWRTIPSWDLVTLQDKNIPAAAQRFMAHRAHARTVAVNASHAVTVSHPGAVTRLIEQAAHATTR
ncbi:alpha/beta fold hydrolase [Streptomyces sp. NPDC001380]|uniref:alpha/beta fold hydrolase n=1 Tax=Streptomyces sp. NPDC001380 TaxID=3364566 RepID=UPI00369FA5BB